MTSQTPPAADEQAIWKLRREIRSLKVGADHMDLFGDPLPEELKGDYAVEDMDSALNRAIHKKYRNRARNTARGWNRVQLFLPELMHADMPGQKVLEMSTAHGGLLEVLRYFGHDVLGNDYVNLTGLNKDNARAQFRGLNDESFARTTDDYGLPVPGPGEEAQDWPYRKIIESIDIPMKLFDGGKTPYPFDDKSFDVLICMQALAHYCHPRDWLEIVDEFCRITRKTIVILLNPMKQNMAGEPEGYADAFQEAKLMLRNYRRNGFTCTSAHVLWGEPLGFKLTADC